MGRQILRGLVSPPRRGVSRVNTVNTVNKAVFTEGVCVLRVGKGERDNRQPLTSGRGAALAASRRRVAMAGHGMEGGG